MASATSEAPHEAPLRHLPLTCLGLTSRKRHEAFLTGLHPGQAQGSSEDYYAGARLAKSQQRDPRRRRPISGDQRRKGTQRERPEPPVAGPVPCAIPRLIKSFSPTAAAVSRVTQAINHRPCHFSFLNPGGLTKWGAVPYQRSHQRVLLRRNEDRSGNFKVGWAPTSRRRRLWRKGIRGCGARGGEQTAAKKRQRPYYAQPEPETWFAAKQSR